jgi:hypothetical protein
MLDFQIAKQHMGVISYGDRSRSVGKVEHARHMFYREFLKGKVRRWFQRRFLGQNSELMELSVISQELGLHDRWGAGIRAIPMEQIMGSMGRAADFDIYFAPMQKKSETRWTELALARLNSVVMPPIRVVQVNQVYFVIDGHHRVSVAKALGERYIEAEITVWS